MSSQQPVTNPYRSPEPAANDGKAPSGARRRRTGLLLAIGTLVVVLLAAFGVAGFAYPGWFLAEGKTKHPPGAAHLRSQGPRDQGRTEEGTTNSALDYLNSDNFDGLVTLTCGDQTDRMLDTIDAFDPRLTANSSKQTERIQVQYALENIGMRGRDRAVASISENFDNLPKSYDRLIPEDRFDGKVDLIRQQGRWQLCGIRFTVPGAQDQDPTAPADPSGSADPSDTADPPDTPAPPS